MQAIFNKELKGYFKSPVGYVFMTFFLVMFGIYFTLINIMGQTPDYSYVLSSVTLILLFGVPILTMRLLSEERKLKTDQLLLTAPVNVSGIVWGKYFAALAVFLITTAITILQPIALSTMGTLPLAKIVGGYIGMILLGATFIAIGLFLSSLTENQIVSALVTFAVFLIIIFIDGLAQALPRDRNSSIVFTIGLVLIISFIIYSAIKNVYVSGIIAAIGVAIVAALYFIKPVVFDGFIAKFFGWFSLMQRYQSFSLGVFDLSTVVYYLSFIIIFVFLTTQMVEKRRWS